jgi:hypothetical protein
MGVLDFFKRILNSEGNPDNEAVSSDRSARAESIALEIDEEDRVVVALAASIMAAEDEPDSRFHISRITRIK